MPSRSSRPAPDRLPGRHQPDGDGALTPPHSLCPAFRAQLLDLAEGLERDLGLPRTRLAIVIHAARRIDGLVRYELSLGGDEGLIRAMRATFPARGTGPFRARLGRLGGLDLIDVATPDIAAAILRAAHARGAQGGSV